jgi:hypothetical protein
MFGWYFKWWRARQLKKQAHIPHKLKLNTQRLKSECVYEIKGKYKPIMDTLEMLKQKLIIKEKKLKMIEADRDEHGIEKEKRDILFTQGEIAKIKSLRRFYAFIVVLFIAAESGLYYLTAQVFLPGGADYAKLILALFLGMVVMVILNFSFEKHFEYREILANKEKLKISDEELKNKRDIRIFGYILGFLSFAIMLAAGLVRIYFLEQMDLSGYTAGEAANLQKVGTWASYLTLAVTFSLAIFLALLKKQQMANSYAYKRYKKWNETIKKTNEYTQAKIKAKQDLENIYKPLIDKYWQLVKELERIWGIEYDEQDKGLFEGFQNLKRSSGLKINDDVYKKFEDVLYSDYDLFKYGIEKDSEVKIIIAQLNENNPAIIPDTVK